VSRFCEKLKFERWRDLFRLGLVNEPNALNDFVVVLFNEMFGAKVALVVQLFITHVSQILLQVLSQAASQSFDIVCLPQLLHVLVTQFNSFPVVDRRFLLEPPVDPSL